MKKSIFLFLLTATLTFTAQSQVNPHAIGLRSGSGHSGYGAEITYQHGLNDANRLEFDLGLSYGNNYSHLSVAGIYHWVWNLTSGLNWYVGPGAQLGLYNYNNFSNNGVTLGLGGQIGLEFDFNELDVPILLSLDTRPMFRFSNGNSNFGYGAALSIRYTF